MSGQFSIAFTLTTAKDQHTDQTGALSLFSFRVLFFFSKYYVFLVNRSFTSLIEFDGPSVMSSVNALQLQGRKYLEMQGEKKLQNKCINLTSIFIYVIYYKSKKSISKATDLNLYSPKNLLEKKYTVLAIICMFINVLG